MSRYMMATKATHLLGDISRDEPDLAIIDSEAGDDYIGEWLTGIGYVGVRFPKATTRELTDDEKAYYRTKAVDAPWGTWPIDPDAPPQAATEDASGPADPAEGSGTGAGDREAENGAQGAMDDLPEWEREFLRRQTAMAVAIEAARDALVAASDSTREDGGCLADEEACFVAHPIHFAWYQAGQTGVLGEASRIAAATVRAAEPILRQAVAEEIRALQSRVTELESQRHAVLEACDRVERDEPSAVFSQGGPVWAIWTADIRAAYEEDDDA